MTLSRRQFLVRGASLGAAAAAAGCALPFGGPRVASPARGVTRVSLGAVTVTSISDGFASRPLNADFVRNAPLAAVQAALAEAGLPTDRVDVPFNPLLVEAGGQRVLFDCGNGEFGAPTSGTLLKNLAAAGISPDSITAVVFSHFHGDHINGLRSKAGTINFPNAKVFAPTTEWNWWMDDARMAATPEAGRGVFNAARRVFGPMASAVVRFEPGAEVLPGIRSIPAYGHTPGHTAFTIEGGSRRVLYWADTTNVAALFVRNPDWAVAFDMDAEAARQVRRRLAERVVTEDMLLAGYHLTPDGTAIGTLSRRGNGYDFSPLKA
jgi:glyoxylase-like metal-dependent hydrolase (beta-lactamase superfamily II)